MQKEKNKGSLICWIDDTEPNKVQDSEVLILHLKQQQEQSGGPGAK